MVLISISDRFDFHVPVPIVQKKKACSSQPTPWYRKLVQKPAIWVCFSAGQHPEAETYPHPTLWISFFSFQSFTGFLEINKLTNTRCCFGVFSSQHIWDFWSNGFCMIWRSKKTTTNNRVAIKKKKKPGASYFPLKLWLLKFTTSTFLILI